MKKKVLIMAVVVISLILLFPIKSQLRDEDTVEYSEILYNVK